MSKIKYDLDGIKNFVLATFMCIHKGIFVHSDTVGYFCVFFLFCFFFVCVVFVSFLSDKPAVSAVICVHVITVTAGTCHLDRVLFGTKMKCQNYAY